MALPSPERVYLSGVPFDPVRMNDALSRTKRALTGNGAPLSVVTPNAVIAGKCQRDTSLAFLLDRASLCLPDGAGTVLASRCYSKENAFPERVAGIDFGEGVLGLAAKGGYPVYLLGGKPGVACRAAERLTVRFPGLRVTGTRNGYFGKDETARVLMDIRASGAAVLFVCLGFPRQELFLLDTAGTPPLSRLPDVRVAAGLGGSLDVWAGDLSRAPAWVRKSRLEWLWRTAKEPRRIRELGTGIRFVAGSLRFTAPFRRFFRTDTSGANCTEFRKAARKIDTKSQN